MVMDRDEEDRKVKREMMAAMAMMGILAYPYRVAGTDEKSPATVAALSVEYADALLKELERKGETK